MKTKEDVEALERLIGQLQGLHTEIAQLAKKAPNDAVNAFKLKLINKVINAGNAVLGEGYRPFTEFEEFDVDDVPTNSDVTLILSQYMEQTDTHRTHNVEIITGHGWAYTVSDSARSMRHHLLKLGAKNDRV